MPDFIDIILRLKGYREVAQGGKQAAEGIEKVGRQAKTTGKSAAVATGGVGKFGKVLKGLGGAAIAAIGVHEVVDVITSSIEAYNEAAAVAAQTNAVIKSTGGVAGITARHVEDLATQVQGYSGMSDEAVAGAENLLLTFKQIRNRGPAKIFDRAVKATADLSVAFHKDLAGSAVLVGKALGNPVKGVTALTRVGVDFSKKQIATIKALVKGGKIAAAQKIILRELESQVKGSAAAFGKTLPGQLAKAREQLGNMQEMLGGALAPTVAKVAGWIARLAQEFQKGTGTGGKLRDLLVAWWGYVQRYAIPYARTLWQAIQALGPVVKALMPVFKVIITLVGIEFVVYLKAAAFVVSNVFTPALRYLAIALTKVVGAGETVVAWFRDFPAKITGAASAVADAFVSFGKAIVDGVVNGIKAAAGAIKDAILSVIPGPARGIVSRILGFGGTDARTKAATAGLLKATGAGRGGRAALALGRGQFGIRVGEMGPETLMLPSGAMVLPRVASIGAAGLAGGGGAIHTHVYLDRRQIAEAVHEVQRERRARA